MIELKNIVKNYNIGQKKVTALKSISLSIQQGEFVCVAGPSGSGKTTLLNIMGCLDTADSGDVVLDGILIENMSKRALARIRLEKIGFIFQSFNLIPVLSVYENIEYPLLLMGIKKSERKELVTELIKAVGLEGLEKRRPPELSGGQQQRVAVARALVTRPLLVLADEPTANLDHQTGRQLIELFHQQNTSRGITFVFSSHDPEIIERADRVIRLRDGMIED